MQLLEFTRDAVLDLTERAAELSPQSFNADSYTVEACFSTGAPVERTDNLGRYLEVLDMSQQAVDLSEFLGAPVLDAHQRTSARAVFGTISAARVESGRGYAVIQLSRAEDARPIVDRIREGTLRSVSIGYQVLQSREERTNGVRTLVATRWKPRELSFVPLPADPYARVRSDADAIRSMVSVMGLPVTMAENLITRNLTVEGARSEVLTQLRESHPPINPRVTRDHADNLVERVADGLFARINPSHQPTAGRPYAHLRMPDLARLCLESRGLSTLGAPAELLNRAMHTTSDFPQILAETFNKSLFSIRRTPSPMIQLFRQSTAADFRSKTVLEMSDGPALLKVLEGGEIKYGTIAEKELSSYKVDSYARGFSISFQALVNDDVAGLQDINAKLVRGARSWYESFLVNTIISNPPLADGKAVFHVDHKNLAATGAAPSDDTIAAGRLAMRLQTDLSGSPLNLTPRYLLIPAALETEVDALLATLYPQTSADAEVAARGLVVIVDSRLDAAGQSKQWYLFSDSAVAPVFEVSDLEGYPGPRVESEDFFSHLGTKFRVVWHVGAGAVDSRGGWKNPGA